MSNFVCPVCGNNNIHSIGYLNGKPYCRRCISFKGEEVERKPSYPKKAPINLSYELSREQKELSDKLVDNYKKGINSLVYAVCGSGKTEIVFELISKSIETGLKVGFVVPRRDVVIELYYRFKYAFPDKQVTAIYGGNTNALEGDLLILTCHQLFRYEKYFDVLIFDEVDAFPFKGNEVLEAIFKRALKGKYVMMSATPSKKLVEQFSKPGFAILYIHTRFHKNPIPVPRYTEALSYFKIIVIIKKLRKYQLEGKKCFIFVPEVEMSKDLFFVIDKFVKGGNYVSSKREGREKIIEDFKNDKYFFLITTAILERGVTVAKLQVIVYKADNSIYDAAALVQIAGRAGRKASCPDGEVIFLASKKTQGIERAINEIKYYNSFL